MALVEKTVLVAYSCEQMFRLVDAVERYPEFMPWCGETSVMALEGEVVQASVGINYHGIRQSFTTQNTRQPPFQIDMALKDGPFRHLDGCWRFIALSDEACKVEFKLSYEFSSKVLEGLVGPVFHYIANTFVDAFVQRAEKIYDGQI